MGKFLAGVIVVSALIAGAGLYYLQMYHFYAPVAATGIDDVRMTNLVTGQVEPVLHDDFEAIDADSSPIRYRACFTTSLSIPLLSDTYILYERAEPLNAPRWFGCFDAEAIGAALEAGSALAFLGERDVEYGIDRVVAITDEGRGYVWHQINRCGAILFDGNPLPEDCPAPPERN